MHAEMTKRVNASAEDVWAVFTAGVDHNRWNLQLAKGFESFQTPLTTHQFIGRAVAIRSLTHGNCDGPFQPELGMLALISSKTF